MLLNLEKINNKIASKQTKLLAVTRTDILVDIGDGRMF